jgi:hypothetical protein
VHRTDVILCVAAHWCPSGRPAQWVQLPRTQMGVGTRGRVRIPGGHFAPADAHRERCTVGPSFVDRAGRLQEGLPPNVSLQLTGDSMKEVVVAAALFRIVSELHLPRRDVARS